MLGSEASCRDELTLAASVTVAAPSGASATTSRASVGAPAASSERTPKTKAAPTRSIGVTDPRAPLTSAPTIAPTPIAATSAA